MKEFIKDLKTASYNKMTFLYTKCEQDYSLYPSLILSLNSYIYKQDAQDYLVPIRINGGVHCVLTFAGMEEPNLKLWRLGTNFLKNYYIVMYAENSTIMFAK